MSPLEAIAIFAAGLAAGAVNTVVGSGTLITFPVLVGLGYAPVVANVSNTIGLVPGSVAGTYGYRSKLSGQGRRAAALAVASILGGLSGAVLLLALPESAFEAAVPVLIAGAIVLVLAQPRLSARLRARRREGARPRRWPLPLALFAIGVYGGYFGAAQGILLLATLGALLPDGLQRLNALKNVLGGATNLVAGLVFVVAADVAWEAAALIAAGALLGGTLGARIGLRLEPRALRAAVVGVGLVAIVRLAF
jgi:uncharacterized membrane protein YfcA